MVTVPDYPFVSVIVLNFNGLVFLERCLASLETLNYPREMVEVLLVDNASSDASVSFVRERFPRVRIIQNGSNLGFAAGNNVGILESKGKHIALLNNDTRVEKNWLIELVKVCESDPGIAACTPKILLFGDRLRIRLKTDPFRPSDFGLPDDPRELGVLVEDAVIKGPDGEREVEFVEGFYAEDRFGERTGRWAMGEAVLSIPVRPEDSTLTLQLHLSNPRPKGVPAAPVSIFVGAGQLAEFVTEYGPRLYEVTLDRDVLQRARPVIQNVGSMILPDGSGRDRGTHMKGFQEIFEEDCGQYDRVEEVFAACGAGALFRRKMFEDVGLLDDFFFMYYEDTDLAWRARLKGWKIVYTPHAIMRHVHCGTSIEWSPPFMFQTYRNRLAMLLKNAPARIVFREWTKYTASCLMIGLKAMARRALGRDSSHLAVDFRLRALALRSLMLALPKLYWRRREIQRTKRVSHVAVTHWMERPERSGTIRKAGS